MSPFYSKRSTYPGNPYAEAKASLQSAASRDSYYLLYKIQSGQQSKHNTGSPYGDSEELQRQSDIYGLWSTIEI